MRAFWEIALALSAVIGLLSIGWLCFGRLLIPAGGSAVVVLPGRGDGGDLEHAVRGILWLRGAGLLEGQVIIADCGLSAQGKAVAIALCLREPSVSLCTRRELPDHIRAV